ncbi:hypothetical protein [Solibacillus sp. FSL K6-4121]|uniref:hypothetical protein n=1 Tax=Solibacillus sp. FSL K6-4121 TaxID=2921505 RepID=UPI0030F88BCA
MNEIKRQLDKKMGDTKARSEKLMQSIENNKLQSPDKKFLSKRYYATFTVFVALLVTLLYINPFETKAPTTSTPTLIGQQEQQDQSKLNLKNFFKQNGDVAYFVGMNNEYASFKETTTWLSDEYVQLSIENGAIEKRKIYKITEDAIYLIFEDMPELQGDTEISKDLLDSLTPISTLLTADLKKMETIAENDVTYPTELNIPLQKFENVIQVTNESKDSTVEFYFAENFGLIGQISSFKEGAPIISLLTSINAEPSLELSLPLVNQDTNEKEVVTFEKLIMIDPLLIYHPEFTESTASYTKIYESTRQELGFIEIDLFEQYISLLVVRTGNSVKTIAGSPTRVADWRFSPDQKRLAIYRSEGHNWSNIDDYQTDSLTVVRLDENEMFTESPLNDKELNLYSQPIITYKWLDNFTLEYTVPDIGNSSFTEAYVDWMKADNKPTKTILAEFE